MNDAMEYFRRRHPVIPTVKQVAPTPNIPAPQPAPVEPPPPPEPDPDMVRVLRMWWLPSDHEERADILRTPAHVYRWALMRGYSVEGAGMWAANAIGLPIYDGEAEMKPWTLKQIKDIAFYRAAWHNGRLRG